MRKFKYLFFLCLSVLFVLPAFAEKVDNQQQTQNTPVVYSYWAGWSNAEIPNFSFNGLFLAFAIMNRDNKGNFYTDYTASNNFQQPSMSGPYVTWNNWARHYYAAGARAYVSYGGGSNEAFRGYIINANENELSNMAGEIKANIKLYFFDGVDLDIESWWSFNNVDNKKFATNLITLVKQLRWSLDNDPQTRGKAIFITVGWNSAGPVAGMSDGGSTYTGSMQAFFSDTTALNAVTAINIMSYDTCIDSFYSRQDLIANILSTFNHAGIPKQKIILGIQPYECGPRQLTAVGTVIALGQYVKQNNYGGLFLWGIGANELGQLSAWDYLNAMKFGLGLK